MTVEVLPQARRPAAPFAPQCPGDRNAFLALLGLTWVGIISGFGLDLIHHAAGTRAYPAIVHLHALLFVGWLVLLTIQLLLVRRHRLDLHRRLGMAMAWLIPAMVVVALATAWTVQRQVALLPGPHDPQFISINLTDMLGFATLAGAGIALRRDSIRAQKADAAFHLLSRHRGVCPVLWLLDNRRDGNRPFLGVLHRLQSWRRHRDLCC